MTKKANTKNKISREPHRYFGGLMVVCVIIGGLSSVNFELFNYTIGLCIHCPRRGI